jgi:hypothetical protein
VVGLGFDALDLLDTKKARYPDEPMKTAHMRYSGKRFKPKVRAVNGRIRAVRLYLSRILIEWMMKCVLVRPSRALGFLRKA